jgi:plasmid maintenance system antidote protein VapI
LGSDAALAKFLGISRSYATRLLRRERPLTTALINKLKIL